MLYFEFRGMAGRGAVVTPIRSLCSGRDTWKVVVRVIRVWESAPITDQSNPYALHMLLIDTEVL